MEVAVRTHGDLYCAAPLRDQSASTMVSPTQLHHPDNELIIGLTRPGFAFPYHRKLETDALLIRPSRLVVPEVGSASREWVQTQPEVGSTDVTRCGMKQVYPHWV